MLPKLWLILQEGPLHFLIKLPVTVYVLLLHFILSVLLTLYLDQNSWYLIIFGPIMLSYLHTELSLSKDVHLQVLADPDP
jgi:hypothetical protein